LSSASGTGLGLGLFFGLASGIATGITLSIELNRGILDLGVRSDLLAIPASRLGVRLKLTFARHALTCRSLAP
jgi:hypothetical protein